MKKYSGQSEDYILIDSSSLGAAKKKINELDKPQTVKLVEPLIGSTSYYKYKGVSIRHWYWNGQERFDFAIKKIQK